MKNEVERLINGRGLKVNSNKNLTENLRDWRTVRNIKNPDTKVYVANVIEELLEIFYKDKEIIKSHQKAIMSIYFDLLPISEINTIDCIQDNQVFSINEIENMGYNNLLCNEEVFKHINCRKQDPMQFLEWRESGPNGKWKKWEQQPKDEIYEPNYEACKIN